MRTVFIRDLQYEQFGAIMDAILETVPFALLNQYYSSRLKIGFFNFWDSDYIPDFLKKFVIQPPISRENVDQMRILLGKAGLAGLDQCKPFK